MFKSSVIFLALWLGAAGAASAQGPDSVFVWTGPQAGKAFADLTEAVAGAAAHGLDPQDYDYDALAGSDASRADPALDRFATETYFALANHLLNGRVAEGPQSPRWFPPARSRDLAAHLERALADDAVAGSLEALAPEHPEYRALQAALANLRITAKGESGPEIEPGPALRTGDSGPRVAQLRARLEAMGEIAPLPAQAEPASPPEVNPDAGGDSPDAPDALPAADLFDAGLEAAVRRIQASAHLREDGIAGADTLAWIHTPIERRIDQVRANLERWRWLPDDFGDPHIRVHIADFRLQTFAEGGPVSAHDVIVGRRTRPTPVLAAPMRYIIANPWWETPHRLAAQDELPLFRRDPNAVQRLGFVVLDRATGEAVDPETIDWHAVSASDFPYRLRQAPGPLNALGQVKLIFPNRHNAYLHDTPARSLFDENVRAFSSGCVRVRDAVDLAAWAVEAASSETAETLRAAIAGGRETRIDLARPIMVHFLYLTALADADGGVRFVSDIYSRDDALIAALGAPRVSGGFRYEARMDQPVLPVASECGAAL